MSNNKIEKNIIAILFVVLIIGIAGVIYLKMPSNNAASPKKAEPVMQNVSSQVKKAQSAQSTGKVESAEFLAAGDNLIHNTVYKDALAYANGKSYEFHQMYDGVKSVVKKSDIAFVNQETMLGGSKIGLSNYPNFNSPQEVGNALIDTGFNLFSTANNHSLDRGFKAIMSSCEYWKSKTGVITDGTYENEAQSEVIPVIMKKGIKVALIAGTWQTNGISKPSGKSWCVETGFDDVLRKTQKAEKIADVVVVSMHWGIEYSNTPNETQISQAQKLADAGADIIIGNHPHVIQKMQWLKAADGHKAIVAFAMGNFLSGQNDFSTLVGGMLTLSIVKQNNQITLKNPRFLPIVTCYESGYTNFRVRLLSDYTKKLASEQALTSKGTDVSPARIQRYVKSIISPEFLQES